MPYPSARGVSLLAGMIAIALGTLAQGFAVPPAPTGMVLKQPQHSVHHRHEGRLGPYRVESPLVFSSSSFLPPVSRGMGGGSSLPATATSMSCMLAVGRTACAKLAPASAAVAAAVLRGGAVVEHNVLSGVLAELANIRTPAALLGGAALGTMFVSPKPTGNKRLHLLYTALATSAFSLQLVCVLCSTLTYTAVASYNEAIAVSAIAFLSDKMQFEFYVIRGSFVYGLFSFLAALMVRGWLTFSSDGNRGSARVMMAILASSGIFLLNFIHHTHNTLTKCLGGMTKRLVWLTMSNMYTSKRRLFRHTLGAAAVWGMVKFFKLGPNEGGGAETAEPQAAGTPKNIPSKSTK